MRRWWLRGLGVTSIATAMLLLAIPLARADTPGTFYLRGTVRDVLARPLAAAVVSDGLKQTATASDGSYALQENSPGRYILTAHKDGMTYQTLQFNVTIPQDQNNIDFKLAYMPRGFWDPAKPWNVSTGISNASGPGSKTLTIVDSAPGGEVGESCVSVIDSQTGTASPATFEKTNGDGTSNWAYVATVGSGVAEGNVVRYTLRLRTCSDLTTLGPDTLAYLFVDDTAPAVTSWSPSLTNHPSPAISIQAYDPNYGFIDMSSSSITVDGLVLPLDDWACGGGGCSVYTHASNLADGPHAIEMVFVDWAGNRGVLDSSLVVDTTGAVLSQPSPTGTITTTTPALSVITTDGGSGVDPKGIAMTLSNGVVSSRLAPTYDPQNGRISYQVPTTVTGVGVGQSPLLDGSYTVTTSVRDRAGNVSSTSWRFTVKTLPL